MPISDPSPISQPSSIAMWPTVTLEPTIVGRSLAQWMTQLSCTLEPFADADRAVVAAQDRAEPDRGARSDLHVTISTAVGAMYASSAIFGVTPSTR